MPSPAPLPASACAVIVAGGTGERFGSAAGKQMVRAGGRSVLAHTTAAFDDAITIGHVVVVCSPGRVEEYRQEALSACISGTPLAFVSGGDTRGDSVANGIRAIPDGFNMVAVHDGARPLITAQVIDLAVEALATEEIDGVVVGHPLYDTLKETDGTNVLRTADRTKYWIAQTPQVFSVATLRAAYDRAHEAGWSGTDDASYVEAAGGVVRMLEGPRSNLKVTVAEDIEIVEAILANRERRACT